MPISFRSNDGKRITVRKGKIAYVQRQSTETASWDWTQDSIVPASVTLVSGVVIHVSDKTAKRVARRTRSRA